METYQDLEPVYNKNQINNMQNQFYYTTKRQLPTKQGEEPQFKDSRDSFNINKVIRTVTQADDTVVVLLDDFNERVMEYPDINPKTNKYNGTRKVRETVQSEIILTKEDGERLFNLTSIE